MTSAQRIEISNQMSTAQRVQSKGAAAADQVASAQRIQRLFLQQITASQSIQISGLKSK